MKTASTESSVSLLEVSAGYGAAPVIQGVSLTANGGSVTALLGPNGAGKTTVLRLIAGAMKPSDGQIVVQGHDPAKWDPATRSRSISFVPHQEKPSLEFTVRETVLMGRLGHNAGLRETADDFQAAENALATADCLSLAERPFGALSGGEAQRVLIARALAQETAVVLMDEPTSHLDIAHLADLARLVNNMAESGKTVIVALHDLTFAARVSDRAVLMAGGQVRFQGNTSDLLQSDALEAAYGLGLDRLTGSDGSPVLVPRY